MSVSKGTIEKTGEHACLRDGANLTPFMTGNNWRTHRELRRQQDRALQASAKY